MGGGKKLKKGEEGVDGRPRRFQRHSEPQGPGRTEFQALRFFAHEKKKWMLLSSIIELETGKRAEVSGRIKNLLKKKGNRKESLAEGGEPLFLKTSPFPGGGGESSSKQKRNL